jgi:DNA-binding PucR family transcriptional regulator
MKYRIKKIEEIMAVSLTDSEIKFSLMMSFKLLAYLGDEKLLKA